jgi:tetratricopeptide (TPR) repeat protein
MAYSIIPPIIIVLSLIGIILFLMKKAPQVRELGEDAPRKRGTDVFSPAAGGAVEKNGARMQAVKHGFFLTLEKTTRKFKVMFLKLENKFTTWNESIKQKRKKHTDEAEQKKEPEDEVFSGSFQRPENGGSQKFSRRGVYVRESLEERLGRPMVSEKAAVPAMKDPEIKDRLEKLLIERIAVNPKDTEAYERLGEYYFEIRNYNYAKECFKQVIKLNPGNQDAKSRMKRLEKILGG